MPLSLDAGPVAAGVDPATITDWLPLSRKDDR
jgi:hypothetical protein